MKGFLGKALDGNSLASSLQSSIASIRETAASSVSKWNPQQANEASVATTSQAKPPREYLRLPLDSARKLRWFDKADLPAIVKTHLQEKRELNELIAALRLKLMRQQQAHEDGTSSSKDPVSPASDDPHEDREMIQLEERAEDIRENDEGVASVLLESCLTSIQELRDELHTLKHHQQHHNMGSGGSKGNEAGALSPPGLPLELLRGLKESIRAAENAVMESDRIHRKLKAQEIELRVAEAMSSIEARFKMQGKKDEVEEEVEEEEGSPRLLSSIASQVSRLEAERRSREEELADLQEQLSRSLREARHQAEAQEQRIASFSQTIEGLRQELMSAEDASEKKSTKIKRLQQQQQQQGQPQAAAGPSMEAVRKLQESCLSAEERASAAERRLGLTEARLSKAESALKEAQGQCKALNRQLEVSDSERRQALERAAEQEAAATAALSAAQASSQSVSEDNAVLEDAERRLREAREEAWAVQSALEARLAAADAREASLLSELREMEALSEERDHLMLQVAALRDKMSDQKDDKAQADHLKGVVKELEESRTRVHEELVVTAQLVTQLESRLRVALAERDEKGMEASAAEMRAREAEASVGREVEERLASACASRALWPRPIREEVDRLEQRLSGLQASLSSTQDRMASDSELQKSLHSSLEASRARLSVLEQEASASSSLVQTLTLALEARVEDLRVRTERLEDLEAMVEELKRQLDMASKALMNSNSNSRGQALASSSSASSAAAAAAAAAATNHSKWQVQNKVGGGGWITTEHQPQPQPQFTSPLTSPRESFKRGSQEGGLRRGGSSQTFPELLHSYPPVQQHQQTPPTGARAASRTSSTSSQSSPSGLLGANPDFPSHGSATPLGHHTPSHPRAPSSSHHLHTPTPAPAPPLSPYKMEGVDIVYLKNVLLKFLEASMAGKVQERDVLLPAVAALLQVTPVEFKLLKKVTQNTTDPASVQVMTAAASTANSIYHALGWGK